jgi:RHH-type proline utilization regulon transcriptional repressor/proline dehydrogenase/delta 1-pyrroline-5-carboxylate dehydrogenase
MAPNELFAEFAPPIRAQSALRRAITAAYRRPEPECLPSLIEAASLPEETRAAAAVTARRLIVGIRAKQSGSGVEALMREYSLSSKEGVALMCMAEALLRIPDSATRDALIRDKVAGGHWAAHVGGDRSLFVNAATWALVVTGKFTALVNDTGLSVALTQLIARCGEPVIRRAVDLVMRMLGEQFVSGETITEALRRARGRELNGFSYSFDMLGEAAMTAADAARYFAAYESAILAIGATSAGRGPYAGPGISIKLSALHPRYSRAHAGRVMEELLPRLKKLALLAKQLNIGLNIDAEEADRLELSLDLLEELCLDPELGEWQGLGFVVQAYGKRCPFVLDFIIDLARRSARRLMVRLVKGAYWDAEIKRAQIDGLDDFPVYTRKVHTDVAYLACARKLLAATDVVFPQFATHNAQTLATIYHMASSTFWPGQYEFQCLHGMGEPLYDEVVGPAKLDRPCRIYAPVGSHETLLAYLVRRLLENGANASFVNRVANPEVTIDDLVADPVALAGAMSEVGSPHEAIARPPELFGDRKNSPGIDLSNELSLASLAAALTAGAKADWSAEPLLACGGVSGQAREVRNPADIRDKVGLVIDASPADASRAVAAAASALDRWCAVAPSERALALNRAADLLEDRMSSLLGLLVREAGKSVPSAIAEVREAIDFLRFYAGEAERTLTPRDRPLGPIVCISPWNFPLAIFVGQIAASLVAGNTVLAKPAEETPLVAGAAVRILHEAGIPAEVLQFLPGGGSVGAALVRAVGIAGVTFTGSTEVARSINAAVAGRLSSSGRPILLVAETGGVNAMIVDSSALAEQVVGDVILSAFDSAGQRCSALRVLCLQDDVAERILEMLEGAMRELTVGRPDRLGVDIGPVITEEAKTRIESYIDSMRRQGHRVRQIALPGEVEDGTFVSPTIIELERLSDLKGEVFGPVLHIVRFRREQRDRLIDEINATGYGLTFGLHTRLDTAAADVTARIRAGNIYINRNMIGAAVGVQPFGGRGLSGTGPKAGGALYLGRLVANPPALPFIRSAAVALAITAFAEWLAREGMSAEAEAAYRAGLSSGLGVEIELPGPVGERNIYTLRPRGRVLLFPATRRGLICQLIAALATGNSAFVVAAGELQAALEGALPGVLECVTCAESVPMDVTFAAALIEGDDARVRNLTEFVATLPGPLVPVQAASPAEIVDDANAFCLNWLLEEVSISINTAAAGGNASLMTIA